MTASRRITPVVLSGGIGARLWPSSRRLQPKQLLPLVGDRSMLRATIDRVASFDDVESPIVVTNDLHAPAIHRELAGSPHHDATLILEPIGRNTAPAVAVAALESITNRGDSLLLILPSDHAIGDEVAFEQAVGHAAGAAESGYLLTFGIAPHRAETGYGYIKVGSPITEHVMRVDEFKEKPDAETAAAYVASGDYLWNSGMFLLDASTYLAELERHDPAMAELARKAWEQAERHGYEVHLDGDAFSQIEGSSIDYTVMEHTNLAAVVPTDPAWNDVGSWASLWDIGTHDEVGNVVTGDVLAVDVRNSFIRAGERLVAVVGLDDVVVVDTRDAVLVTTRQAAQNVKRVTDRLAEAERVELETDGTVLNPWGGSRTLASGPGFHVSHVWLDLDGETPIQVHEDKSGHWHVLRGVAKATIDGVSMLLPERESVYIPQGIAHMLENGGDEVLELMNIEIDAQADPDIVARFLSGHDDGAKR